MQQKKPEAFYSQPIWQGNWKKKNAMNAEFWECDVKMDILPDCLINLQKNYPQQAAL